MKAEIELPPLPDDWADGPVEIRYGVPPIGSMVLTRIGWGWRSGSDAPFVHAVKKWVPQIVTAGFLEPGWLVIEECGTYYLSHFKPSWCTEAREWGGEYMRCLPLREMPQVTGEHASWEIK